MYVHPLLSLPATWVARWSSRPTWAWGFRKCFLCPPKAIKFTKPLTSLWKCKTSGPALACLEDPFAVPTNRTAEVTLLWCTNSRMLHFGAELMHSCVLLHKILASGTTAVFPVFPQWPLYSESEWRISHCLGLPSFFVFRKLPGPPLCGKRWWSESSLVVITGGRAWKPRMWIKSSQWVISLSLEAWFMTLYHLMTTVVASSTPLCVSPPRCISLLAGILKLVRARDISCVHMCVVPSKQDPCRELQQHCSADVISSSLWQNIKGWSCT